MVKAIAFFDSRYYSENLLLIKRLYFNEIGDKIFELGHAHHHIRFV